MFWTAEQGSAEYRDSPESAVLYGASVQKGDLSALLDALRRSYEPSEGAKPSCLDAASALQAYLLLY